MKITEENIEYIRAGHIQNVSSSILINDRFKVTRIDFNFYKVQGFSYGVLQEPVYKGSSQGTAEWINQYFGTGYKEGADQK